MYVITGATGNTGSVVANRLLDGGKKVRVVVRNADKAKPFASRGAEVFVADMNDQAALERAFEGAEGVYLMSPPDLTTKDFIGERKALTAAITKAVVAAKVKHVVLLSSVGAQNAEGTGPILTVHNAEQQLRATNVPSTFLRAAYFAENWAAVVPVAKKDGVLPAFIAANVRIPMVAAKDIGERAAALLLEGPRGKRTVELAGPVEVSPADVAAALTRLLGRTVTVAEAPLAAVVPTFTSFGFSENVAGLFRDMYEGLGNGKVAFEEKGTELVRGKTTIEETLKALL
jgi:uncharacterized protein YbjT (DUF2867 family)